MAEAPIAVQDPFNVLPFEPFISCIQLALPLPEKGYTQGLLQFTMVSKKWRDTIVSTPALWTSITVSRLDPDALAMIGTSLHLSRDAMVTVTFCHTMNQHWALFCNYIRSHANRIQQIVLIDMDLPMAPARPHALQGQLYYLALETVLLSLGDLPAIVSIDVGTPSHGIYPDNPWTERFILPQNVRYMRHWIFQRPGLGDARVSLHQLRELHTDEPIEAILPILPIFLQLECLVLSDPVPGSRHLPTLSTKPSRIGLPFQHDVSRITCLWHTQIFSDSFSGLLLETAQNLRELVIRLSYGQIKPFIDILVSMERLQTLNLSINTTEEILGLIDTSIPPTMTSLRSLSLDGTLESPTETRSLEVLSRLIAMYPNVTNISITFTYKKDITPIIPCLQKLNHLRTMSMVGLVRVRSTAPIALRIPSLEEVSVERGDNLDWLVAPNVLRLVYGGDEFLMLRDFCQRSPLLQSVTLTDDYWSIPTSPEPSPFPSVRELHVRLRQTSWAKSTITKSPGNYLTWLPSLRKISISSVNFDVAFTHTTSLCLGLLYHPDICPKLQELVFEGVPEWDILFSMLEARNLSTDPSISHITRITISLIPYHLRSPLASVLRGEPATRPSNEDISIEAMSQLFFDKTIPGCFTCLHNMLPMCNAPMDESYSREIALYFHDIFWAKLPESPLPPITPPEVSTWILARPERIRRWIALGEGWVQRDGRRLRCRRRGEAVTVTGLDD